MTNRFLSYELDISEEALRSGKFQALQKAINETEIRSKNIVRNQIWKKQLDQLKKDIEFANQTGNFNDEDFNNFLSRYEALVNQDGFSLNL